MKYWHLALAAAIAPLSAASAQKDAAVLFGVREVEDVSLSPDGTKVAFIAPYQGQGSALFTATVGSDTPPVRAVAVDGKPERLLGCGWVSNTRLVCNVYMLSDAAGMLLPFTRTVALDADGKNPKVLSARANSRSIGLSQFGGGVVDWLPEEEGAVLMTRNYVPENSMGTHLSSSREGVGVDRVDTATLAVKRIESPRKEAVDYISDGHGRIRIMGLQFAAGATGYDSEEIRYLYRAAGDNEWQPLGTVNLLTRDGFDPVAVDRELNVAYGFDKHEGRSALFKVALDGSLKRELVYAHPEVDVDRLIRIGRRHRVVGATYATDRRQAVFFDPALKSLGTALSKALPGLPLIRFVGASADETRLLLWAGSDVDPGRYYVYDKKERKLHEVLLSRPELEGTALAEVKPITYKAADGMVIPAYLTLPNGSTGRKLPAIVMPHGGPGARDEWGFDWLAQFYAAKGYAVLQPNFRGSSGYGDAWFQKNGFQSWQTAIGDVRDGGRWLISEGIADPAKLATVGWSYGGYAALQSAAVEPALFKAVIAIAPVTDLELLRTGARQFTNFRLVNAFIGSGPHVKAGSPAQNAANIQAPVLIFHGDKDLNVDVQHARLMADRLNDAGKKNELVIYPGLDHALDDGVVRGRMLGKSEAFLKAALGL